MRQRTIQSWMNKTLIKNTVVIVLLLLFLSYLGMATRRHIKEYNESLVEVRVTMPGVIPQVKFYALDAVVEENQNGEIGPGKFKVSAILPRKEYYETFEWKENDRGKIRMPDGRGIEKNAVRVETVAEGSKITFTFDDAEVKVGDAVQLTMDVRLTRIVLNAMRFDLLREEDNKYYFYEVLKQRGVWGDEYVIKKNFGNLKGVEGGYAYFRGYAVKAPIVQSSDVELTDGMRVKFRYKE